MTGKLMPSLAIPVATVRRISCKTQGGMSAGKSASSLLLDQGERGVIGRSHADRENEFRTHNPRQAAKDCNNLIRTAGFGFSRLFFARFFW